MTFILLIFLFVFSIKGFLSAAEFNNKDAGTGFLLSIIYLSGWSLEKLIGAIYG